MVEIRPVVFCRICRVFWSADDAAACIDPGHTESHRASDMHVHRDEVELPDGTIVLAATFDERDPYHREVVPDFGVYLDARWQPPWPHVHVDWPDFGIPPDPRGLLATLADVLARAKKGERIEVGCWGAHGRTGTALACLGVLTGCPPGGAVAWVRKAYCDKAVETPDQAAFIAGLAPPS